jgi:hypothetical protein
MIEIVRIDSKGFLEKVTIEEVPLGHTSFHGFIL